MESTPTIVQTGMRPHRAGVIVTIAVIGFFILGPVLGGLAWVLGNQDLAAMRAGQMDPSGKSLTETGRNVGILDVSLWLIGIIFFVAFVTSVAPHRVR